MTEQAKLFVMNPGAAQRAERLVYPLIMETVDALRKINWNASAIRFRPPEHLRGTAGGDAGFVLGVRVMVRQGDPRIEWRAPPESARKSATEGRPEGLMPAGFTFSPAERGFVYLLSDMDDGSGQAIRGFLSKLADTVEGQRFSRVDAPRRSQSFTTDVTPLGPPEPSADPSGPDQSTQSAGRGPRSGY